MTWRVDTSSNWLRSVSFRFVLNKSTAWIWQRKTQIAKNKKSVVVLLCALTLRSFNLCNLRDRTISIFYCSCTLFHLLFNWIYIFFSTFQSDFRECLRVSEFVWFYSLSVFDLSNNNNFFLWVFIYSCHLLIQFCCLKKSQKRMMIKISFFCIESNWMDTVNKIANE